MNFSSISPDWVTNRSRVKFGFEGRQRFQLKLAAGAKLIEGFELTWLCIEQTVFRHAVFGAYDVIFFFDLCDLAVHLQNEFLKCIA